MIFYIDSHRTDIFFGDTIFLIEDTYMTIESVCLYDSSFSVGSIEWDEYSYKHDTSNDFYKREMSRGDQKWKKYEYQWKYRKKGIHPKVGYEVKARDKCPEDASESPYSRHIPDRRSARGELVDTESYRIGRYHSEKYTCWEEEESRCDDRSYTDILDILTEEFENGLTDDIGDGYSDTRVKDHTREMFDSSILLIGESSSDIVSDREAREDDTDHRGPHECRSSIVGSEDPCTDDLIGKYDKSWKEDSEFEKVFSHKKKNDDSREYLNFREKIK